MKTIITALTLTAIFQIVLLLTPVNANNSSIVAFNDPIEYSQCTTSRGSPVHTSYDHKSVKSAMDYAVAWRIKDTAPTYYYIHMNYDTFKDAPTAAKEWVWYHECGHHRLGHTLDIERYAESTRSIIAAENAADCFASKEFFKTRQMSELVTAFVWMNKEMGMSTLRLDRIKRCK